MRRMTKLQANARLKELGSPIVVKSEPTRLIDKVKAYCTDHKVTYEPYLGNLFKGCGCPSCKTEKLSTSFKASVPEAEFKRRLALKNPDARIVFYEGFTKPCKIRCLKCGMARKEDEARIFTLAGCQECKLLNLTKLKKDRTKAYREELAKRKADRQQAYFESLKERLSQCEHVTAVGDPFLFTPRKKGYNAYWKVRAECNYCGYRYTPRVENICAGTKCKKCAMRWAKNKEYKLGNRVVQVQGYEPQALDYVIKHKGIKPSEIEVEKIPRIKYKLNGRTKWYYPDFAVPSRNIIVEVKSDMTLGVGGWWGKGAPPFEKNKAKHQAVLDAGYKFKLLVVNRKGRVVSLDEKWLKMSREQVKALLA